MRIFLRNILLVLAPMVLLSAAPVGSFSAFFPNYTFTGSCADPVGASIAFPGLGCNQLDLDYSAVGSTSVFSNAQLLVQTILIPALPPPFAMSGTFSLSDLDNPGDSITGTFAGFGNVAGPPGPPIGFPPFVITANFVTSGGTGAYSDASGTSMMSGTATFTTLSDDGAFASGNGSLTFEAVPEPSTGLLSGAAVSAFALYYRRRRKG
jgi:hypothetical protein